MQIRIRNTKFTNNKTIFFEAPGSQLKETDHWPTLETNYILFSFDVKEYNTKFFFCKNYV